MDLDISPDSLDQIKAKSDFLLALDFFCVSVYAIGFTSSFFFKRGPR